MRVVRLLAILAIFILGGALAWNWYSNERIVAEPMPVLSLEPLDGRADFAFEAVEGPISSMSGVVGAHRAVRNIRS